MDKLLEFILLMFDVWLLGKVDIINVIILKRFYCRDKYCRDSGRHGRLSHPDKRRRNSWCGYLNQDREQGDPNGPKNVPGDLGDENVMKTMKKIFWMENAIYDLSRT